MTNTVLTPTLFHEDWWLNAATNGLYEVAEVSKDGQTIGRLPYCRSRRAGMLWLTLPEMTHFLGPAANEGSGNSSERIFSRLEITRELLRKLPPAAYLKIKCHRGIDDVIPFQEQKFRTGVQFTYVIHPASEDILWSNIDRRKQRTISKAMNSLTIVALDDPAAFVAFYRANIEAQGIRNRMNMDICHRIIEECLQRKRGIIYGALDKNKDPAAAVFCAWDDVSSYLLLMTRTLSSNSGATSVLAWHAMQEAARRQLIFDFDGLGSAGAVHFTVDFGGKVEPRYLATKMTAPVRIGSTLLALMGKEQFFY